MFTDRTQAGKLLGEKLAVILKEKNSIILSIPRGGVIIGNEIAKIIDAKLDVIISKKITPPGIPEFAIGSIMHDGTTHLEPHWRYYSDDEHMALEIEKKKKEVHRRLLEYRKKSEYTFDESTTVVVVDDGIATGSTVKVILKWLAEKKVKDVMLAIPVMPSQTYEFLKKMVNVIIVLEIPSEFLGVGQFYKKFDQVSDDEVIRILNDQHIKG